MELIFLLIIVFLLLVSAGYFVFQLLAIEEKNIFTAMWIGLLPIGLLGYVVNFFFPLQSFASAFCLVPSILGSSACFRRIQGWLNQPKYTCICQIGFLLAIIVSSLGIVLMAELGMAYDTDLYHLQVVSWSMEFPTVAGLGNVHSRLANASTWYILSALLPLKLSHVPTFMTALFFVGVFGWVLSHLLTVKTTWEKVFFLCLIPLCLSYIKWSSYAGLYSDKISLFIAIIASYVTIKALIIPNVQWYQSMALIIALLALGFSIKPLIIIPLMFGILFCAVLYYAKKISLKDVLKIFALPILLGCVWCIRNVIVSGYPVFPTALFAFPVDWLMPTELVDGNRKAVMGWARWPRGGYLKALESGIFYWFPSWFNSLVTNRLNWYTFLVPLLGALGLWVTIFYKKLYNHKMLAIFFCGVISLVYWFVMYPDPRFGAEFAWILLACGGAFLVTLDNRVSQGVSNVLQAQLKYVSYGCLCLFFGTILFVNRSQLSSLTWDAKHWPEKQVRQVTIAEYLPEESFSIWIPQEGDDRCGLAPLPCGNAYEKLRMREQNNLSQGFYILK